MSLINNLRRVALLALVAGSMGLASQTALADSCYVNAAPQPVYAKVVTYVTKQVAYTAWTVKYDHCGVPYRVPHTCYRTVKVPVERVVVID